MIRHGSTVIPSGATAAQTLPAPLEAACAVGAFRCSRCRTTLDTPAQVARHGADDCDLMLRDQLVRN